MTWIRRYTHTQKKDNNNNKSSLFPKFQLISILLFSSYAWLCVFQIRDNRIWGLETNHWSLEYYHEHTWQVEQKPWGRGREWATLGVHPLSWLLSNNRLEKVPFVSVPHTSSNRLLLSNQDKGCTPSVAHFLALPLGPALLNLWTMWVADVFLFEELKTCPIMF